MTGSPAPPGAPARVVVSGGEPPSVPRALARRLALLLGLGLAMLALAPPGGQRWFDTAALAVAVRIPDWLMLAIVIGFAVAALAIIALSAVGRRRVQTPRAHPRETTLEREMRRVLIGVWASGLVAASLLLALLPWIEDLLTRSFTPVRDAESDLEIPDAPAGAGPEDALSAFEPNGFVDGLLSAIAAYAGLVMVIAGAGIAIAALVGLVAAVRRWRQRRTAAAVGGVVELARAVDDGIDRLESVADPRAAIVECYARFESAAAAADRPRRPAETAREFLEAALATLALPADAVGRLTDLFELARFSLHPVGATERADALAALGRIKAALDARA